MLQNIQTNITISNLTKFSSKFHFIFFSEYNSKFILFLVKWLAKMTLNLLCVSFCLCVCNCGLKRSCWQNKPRAHIYQEGRSMECNVIWHVQLLPEDDDGWGTYDPGRYIGNPVNTHHLSRNNVGTSSSFRDWTFVYVW